MNAGPGVASFHVIGTILDIVRIGGNPANTPSGLQTFEVGAGNGASIDFTIPEAGQHLLVDHDQLAHLPERVRDPIHGDELAGGCRVAVSTPLLRFGKLVR